MFTIKDVIRSLNTIEVKGKHNLDTLLGCILALEEIDKALAAPVEKGAADG